VDPDDVIQGRLGNCWFLQCISALATRPHLIERLITPKMYSPEGVYAVKVFDEGKWYYILIDDYVPCQGRNYSCCRSRGEKIWPQILEKAYAKLHTCYQSMVGGTNTYCFGAGNVLRMLTSNPSYQVSFFLSLSLSLLFTHTHK